MYQSHCCSHALNDSFTTTWDDEEDGVGAKTETGNRCSHCCCANDSAAMPRTAHACEQQRLGSAMPCARRCFSSNVESWPVKGLWVSNENEKDQQSVVVCRSSIRSAATPSNPARVACGMQSADVCVANQLPSILITNPTTKHLRATSNSSGKECSSSNCHTANPCRPFQPRRHLCHAISIRCL